MKMKRWKHSVFAVALTVVMLVTLMPAVTVPSDAMTGRTFFNCQTSGSAWADEPFILHVYGARSDAQFGPRTFNLKVFRTDDPEHNVLAVYQVTLLNRGNLDHDLAMGPMPAGRYSIAIRETWGGYEEWFEYVHWSFTVADPNVAKIGSLSVLDPASNHYASVKIDQETGQAVATFEHNIKDISKLYVSVRTENLGSLHVPGESVSNFEGSPQQGYRFYYNATQGTLGMTVTSRNGRFSKNYSLSVVNPPPSNEAKLIGISLQYSNPSNPSAGLYMVEGQIDEANAEVIFNLDRVATLQSSYVLTRLVSSFASCDIENYSQVTFLDGTLPLTITSESGNVSKTYTLRLNPVTLWYDEQYSFGFYFENNIGFQTQLGSRAIIPADQLGAVTVTVHPSIADDLINDPTRENPIMFNVELNSPDYQSGMIVANQHLLPGMGLSPEIKFLDSGGYGYGDSLQGYYEVWVSIQELISMDPDNPWQSLPQPQRYLIGGITIGDASTPLNAEPPTIMISSSPYFYNRGDVPSPLSVYASVSDGGTLTYQWYRFVEDHILQDNSIVLRQELLEGETDSVYYPSTDDIGSHYYAVEVSNTNSNATGINPARMMSDWFNYRVNDAPAIDPDRMTFDAAIVGYAPQQVALFTVTNPGISNLTNLQASLSAESAFEIIDPLDKTTLIAPGGSATIGISPKVGLEVGNYSDTLTIAGDNGLKLTTTLSFTVKPVPVLVGAPGSGDLDGDGGVTAYEAVLLVRYITGLEELTPDQIAAADMDGDGFLTIMDAVLLLRKVVGL
ncbi:MAG: dockerin type I repeat-containing protein [Clostridiales Family XIII bacterium]|jgi:hypothetical protein|nr:dockerin type I repeat-containing protein [Clostridiales Family XIII bacterium]